MEGQNSTCWSTLATTLIFLVLLSSDPKASAAAARPNPSKSAKRSNTQFIRTSCGSTAYPRLCFTSLSPYASEINASPAQLAQAALSVSLAKAQSVSQTVSKMSAEGGMSQSAAAAAGDCAMTMSDSVVMLQRSLDVLGRLGSKNVRRHMGNMQTWVIAALTDQNACMDSFAAAAAATATTELGTRVTAVRDEVMNAGQLTRNALSLVNSLAASAVPPTKQKHP